MLRGLLSDALARSRRRLSFFDCDDFVRHGRTRQWLNAVSLKLRDGFAPVVVVAAMCAAVGFPQEIGAGSNMLFG
jgi:hypothetical protein